MTLNQHYKDRTPSETIEIIKKFFNKRNYQIKINYIKSCIDSYSCTIDLYKNSQHLLQANGKGLTKKYALASGLGELYERFCSKKDFYTLPFLQKILIENNFSKYNYYYDKNEQIVNEVQELNLPQNLKTHFEIFLGKNSLIQNNFFQLKTNNKFVEVPFINAFNEDEKIYLNLPLLYHLTGTNGLAAGNNFYEAFNQGASELLERFCLSKIQSFKDTFYIIDPSSIKNETLVNMLKKIEKDNNKFFILDLSYTYNLPVVGLITFNNNNLNSTLSFGSFPVFEIALERCITETYQNYYSQTEKITELQEPYINKIQNTAFDEELFTSAGQRIFPFKLFENCKYKKTYNKKYFLSPTNHSNKELYYWILNVLKENNLSIFYYNHSLIKDMYAIQLYSYEMSQATELNFHLSIYADDNKILKGIQDLQQLNNNFIEYLNNQNNQYLINILNFYNQKMNDQNYHLLTQYLDFSIPFLPITHNNSFYFLNDLIYIYNQNILNTTTLDLQALHTLAFLPECNLIKSNLILYLTFIQYLFYFNYSLKNIEEVFKRMGIEFNVYTEYNYLLNDNLYFLKQTFFKLCNSNYKNLLLELYESATVKEECN